MTPPPHFGITQRRASELALVGIIAWALFLRLWNLRESLWVDELHTAWCALGSLDEVASRAASGNQSPVFFWIEWLLIRVLGPGEVSLRLPSVIAGTLLPAAMFFLARRWASAGMGLLAAAMVALDPTAIFYATEARPYALIQLLTVLHVDLLLAMLEHPAVWRRGVWIGLAALLFHLHYTAALMLIAETLWLASQVALKGNVSPYRWQQALLDVAILGLLCLPAVGVIGDIFPRRNNWEFVKKESFAAVFEWWPAGLGGFYVAAAAITARARPRQRVLSAVLLAWFFFPATIAWFTTQLDFARLFFPRYLIAAQPAAILLGAHGVTLGPWKWSAWFMGFLLLGASIFNSGIVERWTTERLAIAPRGENWRQAIAWLNEHRPSRPFPVIVASGLIELKDLSAEHNASLEDYCLYPVTALYPLDAERNDLAPLFLDRQGRLPQLIEMLAVHRAGAWLVVRGNKPAAIQMGQGVAAQLAQPASPAWRSRLAASFPGVQLLLIEPEGPTLGRLDLRP